MATARGPLERTVRSSVRERKLGAIDKAAIELAITYARNLDHGGDLDKIGPKLLAALDALALTPKARAAIGKAVKDGQPAADPIDELRARRAARQHHAAAVDAAPARADA